MARYWLGPWQWNTPAGDDGYFSAPANAIAGVDLRSVAQCAAAGVIAGFGLFITANAGNLGSDYTNLGTDPLATWTAQQQTRWQSALRLPATLAASNLRDAIWETLTIQADPTGDDRAPPIVPAGGRFQLHLAGQLVKERDFRLAAVESSPLLDLLKRQYRQARQDSRNGISPPDHYRKILGGLVRKYAISYRAFHPADLPDEAPLDPETTITDNFDRADGAIGSSSEGWSWSSQSGTLAIVSNQVKKTSGNGRYRADSDLSSSDNYAQADLVSFSGSTDQGEVYCRFSGAAFTAYCYFTRNNAASTNRLLKVVAGAFTQIGSTVSGILTPTTAIRVNAAGSVVTGYAGGSLLVLPVTDTAIVSGTRTGIGANVTTTQVILDNFTASDLSRVRRVICSGGK